MNRFMMALAGTSPDTSFSCAQPQARRSSASSSGGFTSSELQEMQAGPFTPSELQAAAAEMQAEVEVGTAAQPSLHPAQSEGSKLYLAAHQPAFERALLLAVRPHATNGLVGA